MFVQYSFCFVAVLNHNRIQINLQLLQPHLKCKLFQVGDELKEFKVVTDVKMESEDEDESR